jgi:VWFA-related protein
MRVALVISLAVLVAGAVAAQTAPVASAVSGVELRVVNVDVMVTDSAGNSVGDLTPGDFELLEDGEPQRITNFFRVVDGTPRLDPAQASAGVTAADDRFRRRVLLVIDNNFLEPVVRRSALENVKEFVAERFGGDAEWSVAAIGEGLQYLMPFTRERYQVSAALDEVNNLQTYADRHQLDRKLLNDPIRTGYMTNSDGSTVTDMGAEYRFSSREQAMRNLRSFGTMARVLGGLMRSYASWGGRKAVVLVSGQMEFQPEQSYLVSRDPSTTMDTGQTKRVMSDPGLEAARRELETVLDDIVRTANSAGFQLYTLTARGLTNPMRLHDVTNRQLGMVKDMGAFTAPPETSDIDTAPRTISVGTGGLALRSNRLADDLARVMADTASYYSLGYEPEHGPDRRYHRIVVKSKRSDVKVRYREGYLDLSEGERLAQELATPLAFPKPKGTLPVELTIEERGAEGGKVKLVARASLPMSSLTILPAGRAGGARVEAEVYLAVYNEEGDNIVVDPHSFPLEIPAGQEEAAKSAVFRPAIAISLEPGAYTISITIRDPVVREHGTALRPVLVGATKS